VSDPVIIEAACNGVTSRDHNPLVPISASEQAKDAIACVEAGATVVHTHARDFDDYAAAYEPVVAHSPGVICYPTTGIAATIEERYRHVELLAERGLIRAGFVDTGSVNLGGTGADGLPVEPGYVYANNFADIAYKMRVCRERGLGPSIAVFEPGFLRVALAYHAAGALPDGALVKFYFSAGGYLGGGAALWGAPPIIESLDMYLAMLGDAPIPWAVAVLGGSVVGTPIARAALERGGHLRVGIEDWDDGPANAEQVRAAARLCEDVGRTVASVADAERLLNLPAS
jgi:3-keto-5-aminohexanoate cleavage enzyme